MNMFADDKMAVDIEEKAAANNRSLPFPNVVSGEIHVKEFQIYTMKRPQLMDLCRQCQLPVSGNMKVLRARLEEFSRSTDKWDQLTGHARRAHLGPHPTNVPKVSAPKKSTQRRTEMFEKPTNQPFPSILSTAVPELRWNQAQHTADLNWAHYIMNLYPYRVEETRMMIAEREAGKLSKGSPIESDNSALKTGIDTANTNISKILEAFRPASESASGSEPSSTAMPQPPQLKTNTLQPSSTPCTFSNPHPSTSGSSVLSAPSQKVFKRSITLAHGQLLEFTMDDVPAPPALSFAKDIPSLNRMWDDESEHWDGHSKLVIRGVAIPIVYWKGVYTSKPNTEWLPKQWESLKGKWFDWKILVERWRSGTPEEFWEEFSEDGKRCGYKIILKRLAEQRVSKERQLADEIKAEYGDQFSSLFSYVKKGRTYVKVKPCHIIKQYRKIKGLSDFDDHDSDVSDSE